MIREDTTEDEVQRIIANTLRYEYDDKSEEVDVEYYVKDTPGSNYVIDVAIPSQNIAIECKGIKDSNKQGVGQCIAYEVDGWSSYLCVPDSHIDFTTIKRCARAQVGLVGIHLDDFSSKYQRTKEKVTIYIQRRCRLKFSSREFCEEESTVQVNEILDMLHIESIDDVRTLKEHLIKAEKSVPISKDDTRWRDRDNVKLDRSILPES